MGLSPTAAPSISTLYHVTTIAPTPTATAPSDQRVKTLITTLTGPKASREVTTEITRLETLYLKRHQKRLPVDLFVSSTGYGQSITFSIIAYAPAEHAAAVAFLRENATQPAAAAVASR